MIGLLIDNYDSFTYNLYQYLGEINSGIIDVMRNDQISLKELKQMDYDYFVLSPGPGHPAKERDFGICKDIVKYLGKDKPILGICLGHQGIGFHFGAKIKRSLYPLHGKTSPITHNGKGIFKGIPNPINVGRYHSLEIDPINLPSCLEILATAEDGTIMAIRHTEYPIIGVQFHPESILTKNGKNMFKNFLNLIN